MSGQQENLIERPSHIGLNPTQRGQWRHKPHRRHRRVVSVNERVQIFRGRQTFAVPLLLLADHGPEKPVEKEEADAEIGRHPVGVIEGSLKFPGWEG
ncbi:MAG: hypothetical protein HY611_05405 [Elusimicrobia bacterium]|nr:hypothetical protein [Elusimicrobiota bacterium]